MKKHILFVGKVKYLRRQIAIIKEIEEKKKEKALLAATKTRA